MFNTLNKQPLGQMQQQQQIPVQTQPFQQQQQQQQPASSFIVPTAEVSRFAKYQLKDGSDKASPNGQSASSSGSSINTSATAKHKIPSRLIKRTNKVNNKNEDDKPSIPILPFKQSTHVQTDTFNEDFAYLYKHDKPPTKSLFDPMASQDETTTTEILMGDSVFKNMTDNPLSFKNVFNRPENKFKSSQQTVSQLNNDSLPWSTRNDDASDNLENPDSFKPKNQNQNHSSYKLSPSSSYSVNNLEKLYYSVIVYGFDDSNFSLVVEHFAKFGKIMEDLTISDGNYHYGSLGNLVAHDRLVDPNNSIANDESATNKNNKKSLNSGKNTNNNNINPQNTITGARNNKNNSLFPIFMGEGWIKLTYDNTNSAIRALAENLTDDGNGNILGVIPYSKEDLEILINDKISNDLDIGNGLKGLSHDLEINTMIADNEIGRYLVSQRALKAEDSAKSNGQNQVKKLGDLKDGSNLILRNQKQKEVKSFWNKGFEFLFGEGEI